ncbi:hypothetical protein [Actinophytocola gossypii]|uniref:Uncharacterized protein n=1 Tax=Actinophytocola gossypii TaxID=2812003 RepID=A0ABT2J176_9PSEU|nr:hypothetical protein [Actinophytocola gossypii]MCT2581601.1 hypothetical protein [Actinophytocola gossypii]
MTSAPSATPATVASTPRTSTAGTHRTSPSFTTNAPTGLATSPRPPPSPRRPALSRPAPPPPPPTTRAAGITATPSFSYGSA